MKIHRNGGISVGYTCVRCECLHNTSHIFMNLFLSFFGCAWKIKRDAKKKFCSSLLCWLIAFLFPSFSFYFHSFPFFRASWLTKIIRIIFDWAASENKVFQEKKVVVVFLSAPTALEYAGISSRFAEVSVISGCGCMRSACVVTAKR